MNEIEKALLQKISGLHKIPSGAFNIRSNGKALKRQSSSDIEISPKEDGSGIDVIVKPNVKNKSVHIPVIITVGGLKDLVGPAGLGGADAGADGEALLCPLHLGAGAELIGLV